MLHIYVGQSKMTESWLISFYWVGTFDLNLMHIYNEPSGYIACGVDVLLSSMCSRR